MQREPLKKLAATLLDKFHGVKHTLSPKITPILHSRQSSRISLGENKEIMNFSSGDYLGMSSHPVVIKKAIELTTSRGAGLSSPRSICGTQDIHKELEKIISDFHGREDTITYPTRFGANYDIFRILFSNEDIIFIDDKSNKFLLNGALASNSKIILYRHLDIVDLESKIKEHRLNYRHAVVATDGVFSLTGTLSPLIEICQLADTFELITFIDDAESTGVIGDDGQLFVVLFSGSESFLNIKGQIDIINSSFENALGGVAGGYTTSCRGIVDVLRRNSLLYTSSTSISPPTVGTIIGAFESILKGETLLGLLKSNSMLFRTKMISAGFNVYGDTHPICPVIMPDGDTTQLISEKLFERGFYVQAIEDTNSACAQPFIRIQITAVHTPDDIEKLTSGLIEIGKEHGVIS